MSLLAANGFPALQAEITRPRYGVWTADVEVEAESAEDLTGEVTLTPLTGDIEFVGTAFRAPEANEDTAFDDGHPDRVSLRIVGGAGGLPTVLAPRPYRAVPLRIPLVELLAEAGETLSDASDAGVLDAFLPSFSRLSGPASHALTELLGTIPGAAWRVLPDGTVWVGVDAFPEAAPPFQFVDQRPDEGLVVIVTDGPILGPAVTFLGRRVSDVVHSYGKRVETLVYFEGEATATEPGGRLAQSFRRLVKGITTGTRFHPLRPATVIRQAVRVAGNGPLEVRFDDRQNVPDQQPVPLWQGVHGIVTKAARGARVLVGWLGGDPRNLFALGWESGVPVETEIRASTQIKLGETASRGAARLADTTDNGVIRFTTTLAAPSVFTVQHILGGVPQGPPIAITLGVDSIPGPLTDLPISGVIDSASDLVRIQ